MIICDKTYNKNGKLIKRDNYQAVLDDGQTVEHGQLIKYKGDKCRVVVDRNCCFLETLSKGKK